MRGLSEKGCQKKRSENRRWYANSEFIAAFDLLHELPFLRQCAGFCQFEIRLSYSVVTYDTGEGVVKVDVSLANRNEWLIKQPGNEELDAALKRFGIKERTVRLSIAYGTTLTSLYLDAQAQ